jgi:hypothetical protein
MFKIQKFRSFGFRVLNLFRISYFEFSSVAKARVELACPKRAQRSERRVYPSSTTWLCSATLTGIEVRVGQVEGLTVTPTSHRAGVTRTGIEPALARLKASLQNQHRTAP